MIWDTVAEWSGEGGFARNKAVSALRSATAVQGALAVIGLP